jgi:hypothetical protein
MAVDPIIADLQYVMETSQELDILNFHKSFPITCKARVETIERDVAVLQVEPPGSVCLEAQEQTIVLSRGLPEAVRARVESFDLVSGMLKLSDFSYVGSHFGDRMIARVQPEDPVNIEIEINDEKFSGTLVDVSLSGVGVFLSEGPFNRGQLLQLTLPLPEGKVTLPGKILNVTETPDQQTRLSIGFTRNAQEIAVVMRYIKDRRIEILNEIEHMYERSYRSKLAQSKDQP